MLQLLSKVNKVANKNLTIGEVEKLRSKLNTTIAEAIQEFEDETGMRVGYIDTIRKRDQMEKESCCAPISYSEDRGDIVSINANLNMDL